MNSSKMRKLVALFLKRTEPGLWPTVGVNEFGNTIRWRPTRADGWIHAPITHMTRALWQVHEGAQLMAQGRPIGIRWIKSHNTATRSVSRLDDIERCQVVDDSEWYGWHNLQPPISNSATVYSLAGTRQQQQRHKKDFGKCLNLRLRCRWSERGIFNSSAAVCACRSENVCTWYGQVQPHTQQLHFMLRHTSSAYFGFCGISTQQNSIIFNFDRFQPDNSGKNLQRGKLSTVVPI